MPRPLSWLFLTACLAMLVSAAAQEEDTSGIAVSLACFLPVLHAIQLTRLSLLLAAGRYRRNLGGEGKDAVKRKG